MTTADILLILVLAGAFLIGFFWGVVRGLLALAAWLVTFLLAAHLSGPVGNYLQSEWSNFSADYNHMLAFLICFSLLFLVALGLIQMGTKGSQDLSRYPLVDDVLGGLLGAAIAIMVVTSVIAILRTFYYPTAISSNVADWTTSLYSAFRGSTIGGQLINGVIPVMNSLLDPLLPATIRGRL